MFNMPVQSPDSEQVRNAGEASLSAVEAAESRFPSRAQLIGLLFGYFALHVVIRTLLSPSADLDESEQLLLTQKFQWGYGSQPPLYTWIQIEFFKVFDVSIFSLALFKNLLLFSTSALTYLNAWWITRSHAGGVAAAASLFFMPQVVWDSQRDLTHSVLAFTLSVVAVLFYKRLRQHRHLLAYVVSGICAGLGLLSKYNYALLLAGLLAAAVSMKEFRPVVLNWRMPAALAVMGLICLPHALWVWEHRELAFQSASKFDFQSTASWPETAGVGLRNFLMAALAFLAPLAGIYTFVFWRRGVPALRFHAEGARLIARALLIILSVVVILVVGFRAAGYRQRWFQPIFIHAPVLAIALVHHRLDPRRLRRLLYMAGAAMLTITIAIPARILLAEKLGRTEQLSRPYPELARKLDPAAAAVPLIVTDTKLSGGNLRLQLPGKIVTTPDLAEILAPQQQPCLLVWDTSRSEAPAPNLRAYAKRLGVESLAEHPELGHVSATFLYHRSRQLRLGMVLLK